MTKIAISGASGKMGKTLIESVINHTDLDLSAAIDHDSSPVLGEDAATLVGMNACGVCVNSDLNKADFDVLIDFTRPEATLNYLKTCINQKKSLVIGTTGFNEEEQTHIHDAAKEIAIMMAPNMSVGVNLSFKLMEMAAQALADSADIEIIEAHHKHKVDAPSGTALAMGNVIANAVARPLDDYGVFTRHGHTGEREDGQIGFSVVRAGDIIGEHTAMFVLDGERIEITHKATNRNIYANGALRAAQWVARQTSPGAYNMQNVLGLG